MEVIIAHDAGGGFGLLAFLPTGLLLLVGLVLVLSPVVSEIGRPTPPEVDDDDDLARLLGEEEAQEVRKRARRRRAVRRRSRLGERR